MAKFVFEYEAEPAEGRTFGESVSLELEAPTESAAVAKAKRKARTLQREIGSHPFLGYVMTAAEPQEPVGTIHAFGEFVSFERYAG